jgi:hypothetical protein
MKNLIKKIEKKFKVSISQDTNYSDQSETFKRFEVLKNNVFLDKILWTNERGFFYNGKNEFIKTILEQ